MEKTKAQFGRWGYSTTVVDGFLHDLKICPYCHGFGYWKIIGRGKNKKVKWCLRCGNTYHPGYIKKRR
ncbi:MAG: hypothetical protein DRJ10_01180 [Bacteroidetes bacterium]|nr:MAG: hypothetical protein DRJ10_01180 [Bacteroidota bacterium]